ncbi:MAG: hypothetical protein ACKVQK_28710 [Burkholderiales bacterium]
MENDRLLLVGSIPFDSTKEVFDAFGRTLSPWLRAMPDGETGPRKHWISRVHYQVLALHPDLEVLRQPAKEDGVERLAPRGAQDSWLFRVRPGVERVRFGDPGWRLGFAREALASYHLMNAQKAQGNLPAHLRLQVSIPSVNSSIPRRVFESVEDMHKVVEGYTEALRDEVRMIVSKIPAGELALQWDCANEIQEVYGAVADLGKDQAIERNLPQFRVLNALLPEEVLLGYHFCFGTLGGWPRFVPGDLGQAVALANAVIGSSGRRVDWVHIPVLDRAEEAFVAPLAGLEARGARIYLGVVHNMERFEHRVALARKYLPEFGMGGYCGFGRLSPSELPGILDEHRLAART